MSYEYIRHLSFVATPEQAASVEKRWRHARGKCTVICLDEAVLATQQARALFGGEVEVFGLSELDLQPEAIFAEALSLAEDLFPECKDNLAARVERWMLESLRRWLVYAVHSVRLVETAFERFQPQEVWLPEYQPMYLTISPDEQPDNPLFFDLLTPLCGRARVKANKTEHSKKSEFLKRRFAPLKYVVGQWLSRSQVPKSAAGFPNTRRPVLLTNLDNDLHRQFDLLKLGPTAKLMFAWLRVNEAVVPVERFLDKVVLPNTTRHDWLTADFDEVEAIATAAGVSIRPFAGLRFLASLFKREKQEQQRRRSLEGKYGVPWWNLLFESQIPYIHRECRLAGAFYCVYEYERTRSVLRRWQPELVVLGNYWTYLPKLAATEDLGIKSIMTSSGINFFKSDFAQRVAPIVCVYGEAEAIKTKEFHPEVRIVHGGDVLVSQDLPGRVHVSEGKEQKSRVILATSGRLFGWWFGSLLLDYNRFNEALRTWATRIRKMPRSIEIVIKSHPVSDLHEVYEKLVAEFGDVFVEHRKAPISEAELTEFDAAVLYSAATTFLAELIRARVPVVYFDGALTSFGKSYFDYEGLMLAENVDEMFAKVNRLIDPRQATDRKLALEMEDNFLRRYVDPERRSFKSVVEEVLAGDAHLPCRTGVSEITPQARFDQTGESEATRKLVEL